LHQAMRNPPPPRSGSGHSNSATHRHCGDKSL
jgi:hypothetical protein